MNKKEINNLLDEEFGIVLIEKKSEQSFFESILENWVSFISFFYFLTRKKVDTLIITQKRIVLILKNKIYLEKKLDKITDLNYDGIKSVLEITDSKNQLKISLNCLHISYEEGKQIKRKLEKFRTLI